MTISSMFYKQVVHVLVNFVFKFLFLREFPSSSDFKSFVNLIFKSVIGICHLIIVEITNHTSSEPSLTKVK